MKTFIWDVNKPYHKQDIYTMARNALKNGYDVIVGWSQNGEHKYIHAGDVQTLKAVVSFCAWVEEYADQLTIKEV